MEIISQQAVEMFFIFSRKCHEDFAESDRLFHRPSSEATPSSRFSLFIWLVLSCNSYCLYLFIYFLPDSILSKKYRGNILWKKLFLLTPKNYKKWTQLSPNTLKSRMVQWENAIPTFWTLPTFQLLYSNAPWVIILQVLAVIGPITILIPKINTFALRYPTYLCIIFFLQLTFHQTFRNYFKNRLLIRLLATLVETIHRISNGRTPPPQASGYHTAASSCPCIQSPTTPFRTAPTTLS